MTEHEDSLSYSLVARLGPVTVLAEVMDSNSVKGTNPPIMSRKLLKVVDPSKSVRMSYLCQGCARPAAVALTPCAQLSVPLHDQRRAGVPLPRP